MTWFRHQEEVRWFREAEEARRAVLSWLEDGATLANSLT
jgi:hypothetical protein